MKKYHEGKGVLSPPMIFAARWNGYFWPSGPSGGLLFGREKSSRTITISRASEGVLFLYFSRMRRHLCVIPRVMSGYTHASGGRSQKLRSGSMRVYFPGSSRKRVSVVTD